MKSSFRSWTDGKMIKNKEEKLMIIIYLEVIQFGFSLLFGVALSVCYAGIELTRKSKLAVGCSYVIFLLVQFSCWWLFGIDLTSKLYPMITHLPLIIFLSTYFKCPWLTRVLRLSLLSGTSMDQHSSRRSLRQQLSRVYLLYHSCFFDILPFSKICGRYS